MPIGPFILIHPHLLTYSPTHLLTYVLQPPRLGDVDAAAAVERIGAGLAEVVGRLLDRRPERRRLTLDSLLGSDQGSEARHVGGSLAGADEAAQAVAGSARGEDRRACSGEARNAVLRAVRPHPRRDVETPWPRRDGEAVRCVGVAT